MLGILDLIGDVFTNLSDLTIEGEMEFIASYPDEEGYLRDNQSRWQRLRFQWRQGCPFAQPEQCERTFDLARENMGRNTPISANFDAQLAEADVLLIGRHQLGLNFGLFVLLALEEWILPLQTGLPAPVPWMNCSDSCSTVHLWITSSAYRLVLATMRSYLACQGCCGISLRTLTTVQICSLSKVKFASLMLIQTSKLTLLPMALGMVTSVMRNHDRTLRTSFQQSVPSKGAETLSVHCSLVLWKKWA